jgi:hypothetical protein
VGVPRGISNGKVAWPDEVVYRLLNNGRPMEALFWGVGATAYSIVDRGDEGARGEQSAAELNN